MVRAGAILLVMMLWLACLAGAMGLPIVLAIRSGLGRRRAGAASTAAPTPPPQYGSLVVLLYGYAAVMGLGALFLSGLLLEPMGDLSDTFAWMALPLWSAVMALLVAGSLRSPQRVRGSMR